MSTPAKPQVDTAQSTTYQPQVVPSTTEAEIERPYAEDNDQQKQNQSTSSSFQNKLNERSSQTASDPDVTVTVRK